MTLWLLGCVQHLTETMIRRVLWRIFNNSPFLCRHGKIEGFWCNVDGDVGIKVIFLIENII